MGVETRPGEILAGKYRVERVLGAGGMGVVVAATHLGLQQLVAIKRLLPDREVRPEMLERFLREARAAVRLKSQHVARVLDVGVLDDGAPYLVMEHLDGDTLGAVLEKNGPLPVADAVEYVLQVCEAIAEAHAAGIVHRDLKPANLFLTRAAGGGPCVKVLDFGISKVLGAPLALTSDAVALGSPLYMSPEQMQSSKDADARADLWSLGVTLYELLAGRTPFQAEMMQELCARVFFGQPAPIHTLREGVPAGLEAVIFQCLEKERDRRWPDAAALAAALAPYAPPRAATYAERVANVLSATLPAARPTALLPEHGAPNPTVAPTEVAARTATPSTTRLPATALLPAMTPVPATTPPATTGDASALSSAASPAPMARPPRRTAAFAIAFVITLAAAIGGAAALRGSGTAPDPASSAPTSAPDLAALPPLVPSAAPAPEPTTSAAPKSSALLPTRTHGAPRGSFSAAAVATGSSKPGENPYDVRK